MPKISVIVPIYKVEPWLNRCVDSILGQTFTDFELILVDDGSPDRCPVICDAYAEKDSRVIVIHKENGGVSTARNVGLDWMFEHSNSQYIAFIDSDDWVHQQYLEVLYNAIKTNNADISVVLEQSFLDGMELSSVALNVESYVIDKLTACHRMDYGKNSLSYSAVWAKLYCKELWETLRFPIGRIYEDAFTMHHIMYSTKSVAVVDSIMYYYRLRNNSISHGAYNVKRMDRIYAYIARADFYQDHGEEELYHETVIIVLKGSREEYYRCLNEIHDAEALAEFRAIFNKYFDQERNFIKMSDHRELWRFRHKVYNKIYDSLWHVISLCIRTARSLRVNGVYGSIKKCKEKISRRIARKSRSG